MAFLVRERDGSYGYGEMLKDMNRLQERYPFIQVDSIGRSVMGRPIPALRIGMGRKEIHCNGAFHANEWITTMLLMQFAEEYAGACSRQAAFGSFPAEELFGQTSLWLVPMVNPDGVELVHRGAAPEHPYYRQLLAWNGGSEDFSGWKANIRGVDLNDQFPAHWEAERERRAVAGPGPRDYGGVRPLSEPEAAAMAEFTRRHRFELVLAFHTQGKEIYWNYRNLEPRASEAIALRLERSSGYKAVKLGDSDAGYKDWFIQQFGRPGFTIEAGIGVNPLPLDQFPDMYEATAQVMTEALACLAEPQWEQDRDRE
ncbi:M14 family metallocarboxypeptidase [Paenibacillus doosanensis]|uniref:M14 family metallopeptidase n=1 Tax=Paenibacillus doosanensis TaxID=1229154 RepID=UPI0021807B83|nr:M14 family metallocarboxypeptidase [Paenibacillus doosanensis]MCS7462250.1 M14 family metallocarboxypeptidase [Paenibacillus doosanensis]